MRVAGTSCPLVPPVSIHPDDRPLSVSDAVVNHHQHLVGFFQRRLRVRDDAQDLAQETYVRLLRYDGSRELRSPTSMMYRIAINVANDHRRAERRRACMSASPTECEELPADDASPLRELMGQQELDIVLDAIDNLPPKCKKVFLLSRFHHLAYSEIAARCGISVKMVEKHVSLALAACLKTLAERSSAEAQR